MKTNAASIMCDKKKEFKFNFFLKNDSSCVCMKQAKWFEMWIEAQEQTICLKT